MSRLLNASLLALAGALVSTAASAQPVSSAQAAEPSDTAADAPGSPPRDGEQAAAASTYVDPAEIIVTARRRDERLIDAPVAITAVSGETLSQYQATRVSDIATLVPSMIASRASSGSSANIFLRGVGSTSLSAGFDQSVSFVIDGLPMSRGREVSLPQFDIQRVEVLKGPQALFFGKNTTGGLISVTSNSPTDRFEAGLKAGYGFVADDRYVEAFISGPLSDNFRARIAGRFSKSDGGFVNTAAETYTNYIPGQFRRRNADRRGRMETFGTRGTFEWDPSETFDLQLKAGFTRLRDGGASDLIERLCGGGRTTPLAANGRPPSPNAGCTIDGRGDSSGLPIEVASANYRYARDGRSYSHFASQYGVLTGTVRSDPFDLTSITGYYHFRQTDLNSVNGEGYPATFSQLADFEQVSQELRFQSKFDGPFNILFGGFYTHGKFTFNTDAYIFPITLDPVANTYVTFKRDNGFESDALSFFAEGTFGLTPELELSAGARYSLEARDSFQRSLPAHAAFAGTFPGGISLSDRYRDNNLSPQVTLRYKPEADTTIYAAYKQGFKSGGFNISQGLGPAALANPQQAVNTGRFGAETAEGGEIGLRTLLLDRRLSVNITAYRYDYSDLQVQFFNPQSQSLTAANAGSLRTQGVELDFNLRVPGTDGLSLRGAAAYNDAKYHDFIGQCYNGQTFAAGCNLQIINGLGTAQNYEGRTPPKAPRFAARGGFTWTMPLADSGWTVRASSDVSYTSRYNFTDALRPDGFQSAYTKIDAALTVDLPGDRFSLALIGRNLTNRRVVAQGVDMTFTGGTGTGSQTAPGVLADMSALVDNPREIFVEATLKF